MVDALNQALAPFPLRVAASGKDGLKLRPTQADAPAGLAAITAELNDAAMNGTLAPLKMCAADESKWVFFDRSKPGTRPLCQSTLRGNWEKTRTYRERHRHDAVGHWKTIEIARVGVTFCKYVKLVLP